MVVIVIRYKTKATARRALTFIVRIFVNDTIAIAVWTSFHVCVPRSRCIARLSLIMASAEPLGRVSAYPQKWTCGELCLRANRVAMFHGEWCLGGTGKLDDVYPVCGLEASVFQMSAIGTKQTFMQMVSMSALRGKADILSSLADVR